MSELKNDANSGVEALTGFSFQRNSAIYLILENYEVYVGSNFFVCIEHHDDVIFAHLNDSDQITEVKSYQTKKSTAEWTITKEFAEIIAKITKVGDDIKNDSISKVEDFTQELSFMSNRSIKLNCGSKGKSPKSSVIIKENNLFAFYSDLPFPIQQNFLKKLNEFSFVGDQLANISFRYIDVGNTDRAQRDQLAGMLLHKFQDKVHDASAAIDLLVNLFRDVETIYNQQNTCKLLDTSKRVYGSDIFSALNVICTKAKAYDLWRLHANDLGKTLKIPVSKGRNFLELISNSFDYFKDLSQIELRRIYKFVDDNRDVDDMYYSEVDCIEALHNRFQIENQTQLANETVASAIIAAYVETRNKTNVDKI
jgi:hypothetical protein